MNYWWMNTDPSSWNIFEEMLPGETEPWDAKTNNGHYKPYMRDIRPNDLGLCYQTGKSGALVAELKAVSSLKTDKKGYEFVEFRLKRFLDTVPWAIIEHSHVVTAKRYKMIRRGTLYPLDKNIYEQLMRLSDPVARDQDEQDDIAHIESKRDLSQIRDELRSLKASDSEQIVVKSKVYIRDNKTIAQLKIMRGYKCQMCGSTIRKKNGSCYVEAAHITPKRHKGPELPSNIIILCPNHHKEFDLGKNKILERSDNLLHKA